MKYMAGIALFLLMITYDKCGGGIYVKIDYTITTFQWGPIR